MLLHRRGLMIAATQPAGGTGGGALPAMTWSASDKSSTITLTNGGLTATTSTAAVQGVRGSRQIPSGALVYAEFNVDAFIDNWGIGIANATYDFTVAFAWQTASANAAEGAPGAGFRYNTSTQSMAGSSGSRIGIAYNDTTKRIYTRTGGVWNNSADPVAGTGGMDVSALTGPVFFLFQGDSGDKVTANFAGSFVDAAPTGYGPA